MNHESNPTLDSLTNNHNPNPDSDLSGLHRSDPSSDCSSSSHLVFRFSNNFDYSELQDNEEEETELELGFEIEQVNSRSDVLEIIDSDYANDNEENNLGQIDNDSGFSLFEELDWEEEENRENLTVVINELTDDENSTPDSELFDLHQSDPSLDRSLGSDPVSGFSNDFDYLELQDNEEEEMELEFGFGPEPINLHNDELEIINLDYANDNEENNLGRVDNDSGFSLFEQLWEEVENRENSIVVIDELTDDEDSTLDLEPIIELEILLDMVVADPNQVDNMVANPNLEHQVDNNYYNDFYLDDAIFLYEVEIVNENNIVLPILPTAEWVVENLPVVEIRNGDDMGCAVCTEDFGVGEKVKTLPCGHYYHGECIGPWLTIRNTCPVCRYKLPTDDLEYERR